MRLNSKEREVIKGAILSLDPTAKVYLFGSRVYDDKKGGDIDILILSKSLRLGDKAIILNNIFKEIEEQKIDIVIAKSEDEPFTATVIKEAVEL